ncbi:MAG: hypothetical protein LBM71_01880, partial [Elusimicrobiota bacterium]|nr:hypothetical protein [Elusimicrobiota bacterium]
MKKKKALLFTFVVFAIGFAVGGFVGKYYTGSALQAKSEAVDEKIDLKEDLSKIRMLQKEITLYTDKAADIKGAILAYATTKQLPVKYGVSLGYMREEELRRKEYYLANTDKIPFYNDKMGETKRRNIFITFDDKRKELERELKAFVDKKMYAVEKQNLELGAKYWAGRVLNNKDVTYQELAANSINWVGNADLNRELIMTVQSYVNLGYVEPLTKEEKKVYDRGRGIVWALLHPGAFDEELIGDLSTQDCIDIISRNFARQYLQYDWDWKLITD